MLSKCNSWLTYCCRAFYVCKEDLQFLMMTKEWFLQLHLEATYECLMPGNMRRLVILWITYPAFKYWHGHWWFSSFFFFVSVLHLGAFWYLSCWRRQSRSQCRKVQQWWQAYAIDYYWWACSCSWFFSGQCCECKTIFSCLSCDILHCNSPWLRKLQ